MPSFLRQYRRLLYQFSRFVGIGFLNTALDFILINIFIAVTGIAAGFGLSGLKVVSFSLAVIHSYYWNRSWAFMEGDDRLLSFLIKLAAAAAGGVLAIAAAVYGASQKYGSAYFIILALGFFIFEVALWRSFGLRAAGATGQSGQQFSRFIIVSVIGAGLAALIVLLMTELVPPLFGANPRLWANIANAVANVIVLFWNFVGYKVFVFRK